MNVLRDKTQKRYSYISRYTPFSYYYHTEDDKYIYGTTSHLVKNITFVAHKVTQADTLDSLALNYYGRPDLYWVIADFNNIQDPFINIFEHYEVLNIPTISDITFKVE